ncbi:MAG: thermonuclease family protein [Desulfocapsaceae bacterium]|nr:thermonuclease family protein [Desulfocapsaceae bacterium]
MSENVQERECSLLLFRSRNLGVLFLIACIFIFLGNESCRASSGSGALFFSASVVKIIDGDTIEVEHLGKKLRVRLWGIDTPEWQQRFSHKAREFTRQHVQGRQVELQSKTWDKYGRLVAMVEVEGRSLNEELLTEGLAWVHIYYCKEPICRKWRQLETDARVARRGLWQDNKPVPPWKWKQDHK